MKKYIPAILITVLCTGLVLKSARYLHATPKNDDDLIAHELSNFMLDHGWKIVPTLAFQDGTDQKSLVTSLKYKKSDCEKSVMIALLTDNTELKSYIKTSLGSDLAIFENHKFTNRQKTINLIMSDISTQSSNILYKTGKFTLPPLAISPAPQTEPKTCTPPAQKHWISHFQDN